HTFIFFFFSSRRRHTRFSRDWSSDVCSSDLTIRQLLQKQDANLVTRESAIFAWIPTLTSVSRQSIFSGKPPLYFPSSINSTNSRSEERRVGKESRSLR